MRIEELIADSINLKFEELAFISLNILPILIDAKKSGKNFEFEKFLSYLEFNITKNKATVLIPTFSREFVEKKYFNRAVSKSRTGFLPNQCLSRDGWWRTAHPIISFITYGERAKELAKYQCYSAFGKDSILDNLQEYNPVQYFIGVEPEDAFTYLHYVEQKLSVPYRYSKIFTGEYIDYDNKKYVRDYEMFVKRDKNFSFNFKKNIIKIFSVDKIGELIIKKIYINDNFNNIKNLINDQRF